jgi:hypothetical protein
LPAEDRSGHASSPRLGFLVVHSAALLPHPLRLPAQLLQIGDRFIRQRGQICLRVPDVDAFYRYCREIGVDKLSEMFESQELKIKAFVFNDPEGYQIEIQQSIP